MDQNIPKYITVKENPSEFVVQIRSAKNDSTIKTYSFPGKPISQPIIVGDIITVTYKSGVQKTISIIDLKRNTKRNKPF